MMVVVVVVVVVAGRGRAERIPARAATCPPTLSTPRRFPSIRAIASTRAREHPLVGGARQRVCMCVRACLSRVYYAGQRHAESAAELSGSQQHGVSVT